MKLALLTIHGMGDTEKNFANEFEAALRKRLGAQNSQKVVFESIYYQDELQASQETVFMRMRPHIDWMALRKFLLYGFSDAASLEFKKYEPQSPYFRTQQIILRLLDQIYDKHGAIPVVILAQSLGCQVISSYLWDAHFPSSTVGDVTH